MGFTMKELIEIYAEVEEIEYEEAADRYDSGKIDKKDLLNAYLINEGIFGYTNELWHIFNTLK